MGDAVNQQISTGKVNPVQTAEAGLMGGILGNVTSAIAPKLSGVTSKLFGKGTSSAVSEVAGEADEFVEGAVSGAVTHGVGSSVNAGVISKSTGTILKSVGSMAGNVTNQGISTGTVDLKQTALSVAMNLVPGGKMKGTSYSSYISDAESSEAKTILKGGRETAETIINNTKRQTPDQKALRDLAEESVKSAKKGNPISEEEAKILDEWASEYNVPQHHQAYPGSGRHFPGGNYSDHTHIYNLHVPYLTE